MVGGGFYVSAVPFTITCFLFSMHFVMNKTFVVCICEKGLEYLGENTKLEFINDLFRMFISFTCVNTDTQKIHPKPISHNWISGILF